MKLLQRAHPHIGGLDSTSTKWFDTQRGKFVQISRISRSHWVTITNTGCSQQRSVLLYNNFKKKTIHCAEQIHSNCFECSNKTHSHCYHQMSSNSMAHPIVEFLPSAQVIILQKLCTVHTAQTLFSPLSPPWVRGAITNSPQVSRGRKVQALQSHPPLATAFKLYCICRKTSEGKMIQCSECRDWFHVCIPPTSEEVGQIWHLSDTVEGAVRE